MSILSGFRVAGVFLLLSGGAVLAQEEGAAGKVGAGKKPEISGQSLARASYQYGRAALVAGETRDGIAHLTRAAEAGYVIAAYDLAEHLRYASDPQDWAAAMPWYERAAEGGFALALNALGMAFEHGYGGVTPDTTRAAELYEAAYEGGLLLGGTNLGWLLANGDGVDLDERRAVALFLEAAEGGVPLGMTDYGYALANGIGMAQDYVEAAVWFRAAANLGESDAMLQLGVLYLYGYGVKRNPETALEWYRKAQDLGAPDALSYIGEVYEKVEEYYNPGNAAWQYVRALKSGDRWPLERGRSSWDRQTAIELQRILRDVGLYFGPMDGDIGTGTRAAMEKVIAGG